MEKLNSWHSCVVMLLVGPVEKDQRISTVNDASTVYLAVFWKVDWRLWVVSGWIVCTGAPPWTAAVPHTALVLNWTQLYTTVSAPTTSTNLRGALLLLTSAQRLQLFQLYGVSFQAVPIVVLLFQLSSTHSLLNFFLRSVLCRSICLPCTAHFVYISFRSLSPRVPIQ